MPPKKKAAEPEVEEAEKEPEANPKAKPVDGTYYCCNGVIVGKGKHHARGDEVFLTAKQAKPIMASVALLHEGRAAAQPSASAAG